MRKSKIEAIEIRSKDQGHQLRHAGVGADKVSSIQVKSEIQTTQLSLKRCKRPNNFLIQKREQNPKPHFLDSSVKQILIHI